MSETKLKILLIEDNPGDARLVNAMLDSSDDAEYEVKQANRLEDAVQLLSTENFDAVLLDLCLPDSRDTQSEGLSKVNEVSNHTPIIAITGHYDESSALESMSHGAQDFLLKDNLRADSLIRSIRYAVEREQRRLKTEVNNAARRLADELDTLRQMRAPLSTKATARVYGNERLAESAKDTFDALVDQYRRLIDQAIQQRTFKIDRKTTQDSRVLAQRLGFLRASPRDLVELHIRAVKQSRPVKMTTSFVVAEEARLLLLELMGNLASYYRDHMMPVDRTRDIPKPASSRDSD